MLTEILRFIKLGFWKKLVTGMIAVNAFTIFAKFPNLALKLAALAVFFVSSGVLMPSIASQFSSQIQSMRRHRRRTTRPMPENFKQLQNRMGVRLKEFATVPGKGAYTNGRCVVFGEKSLRDLDFNGLIGVFAHELAHIRGRHILVRAIAACGLVLVPVNAWWAISSPIFLSELFTIIILQVMATIAIVVFMSIAMIPVNWKLEARADKVATEFVGKRAMESALLNITEEKNHKTPSETHPPISERVKLIRKVKERDSFGM
jgi:Zn-dependent protease with chaperone function